MVWSLYKYLDALELTAGLPLALISREARST